jgi:hypothetical protein
LEQEIEGVGTPNNLDSIGVWVTRYSKVKNDISSSFGSVFVAKTWIYIANETVECYLRIDPFITCQGMGESNDLANGPHVRWQTMLSACEIVSFIISSPPVCEVIDA